MTLEEVKHSQISLSQGILGKTISYPKTYSPEVLYAIPRKLGREAIGWQAQRLSVGVDWWHCFEVSWLDSHGISQVAMARLAISASSPNLVESKSLKLYLNSLNFTPFANWQAVEQTISQDVSACVGEQVAVMLFRLGGFGLAETGVSDPSGLAISQPVGVCLEEQVQAGADSATVDSITAEMRAKFALRDHPDASLLGQYAATDNPPMAYHYYSNLLRSNCPVTDQPDWGTLAIEMTTEQPVVQADLLAYVLSFRQHNGFHEQCVEQIFTDLSQRYRPSRLIVRAWYTRRGGIDINPCRVSDPSLLPSPSRLVRQ